MSLPIEDTLDTNVARIYTVELANDPRRPSGPEARWTVPNS